MANDYRPHDRATGVPRRPNVVTRGLRGVWRALDAFRRVVHLLIMLGVFALIVASLTRSAPPLPAKAALVLAPSGVIVEQLSGDPLQQALDEIANARPVETSVRDLADAIRAAADDRRVAAIALDLGDLVGAGLPNLQRLARELEAFRATGRKVVAYGDFFLQPQYYLAAFADEVYLHPSGAVFMQGYGRYRMYMREALEKLRVDGHVFKVGEYKSFLEPYTRDDMSAEDRASSREWLDALWSAYRADVERARGLEAGSIDAYVSFFVNRLEREAGDLARLAVDAGLVDELRTRDQVRNRLIALAGAQPDSDTFMQVGLREYLAPLRAQRRAARGRGVGVIVAAGDILDGEQPPGLIGGDTIAQLLRRARTDDDVQAVVLRVDSGGGSKFASEIIQREVQLLRESGKPVVASMGNVAASGGYWIAMDADEVWAAPTTITGSIGIGAFFPTLQNSLDALGLHVDGVGTTRFSGEFRLDRDLGEEAAQVLQLSVEYGYRDFIAQVARARGLSIERVDAIARGRVWIGQRAQQLGLVDRLGGLDDAIEAAAALAGLGEDYPVRYIEKELGFREMLALQLAGKARALAPGVALDLPLLDNLAGRLGADLARLARFNDPGHLYLHCFCEVR